MSLHLHDRFRPNLCPKENQLGVEKECDPLLCIQLRGNSRLRLIGDERVFVSLGAPINFANACGPNDFFVNLYNKEITLHNPTLLE